MMILEMPNGRNKEGEDFINDIMILKRIELPRY